MRCGNFMISEIAQEMKVKYKQYFKNEKKVNMLVYVALVFDPRCKMPILECGLVESFEPHIGSNLLDHVKKLLQDLYECYNLSSEVPLSQVTQATHRTSSSSSSSIASGSRSSKFWDSQNRARNIVPVQKTELDKYLADDQEEPKPDFELLNYWKVMEGRFPNLASIARDIFAIPTSTVASESAFSTGGRVITDCRNSLLPKTVEALICTQSWMNNVLTIVGDEVEVILDDDGAKQAEKITAKELEGGNEGL
ncbi:hypothetical protein Dimus_039712 [Dionaea muscipula]